MLRQNIILIIVALTILLSGCTSESSGNNALDGALLYVAEQGWEDVGKLIMHMGADINTKDNKSRTPLMISAGFGHKGFVKILIDNGAELNSKNDENLTALDYARRFGSGDIASLLEQSGAN